MSEADNLFFAAWIDQFSIDSSVDSQILVCRPGGDILVPAEVPVRPGDLIYTGTIRPEWDLMGIGYLGSTPLVLASAAGDENTPDGYQWCSPRTLFGGLAPPMVHALSRASMLVTWDHHHRFCGRCGTATLRDGTEPARVCPSCGHRSYPRVSPAMIVLLEADRDAGFDEPRILLAHNQRFPDGVYSCLAGYVDAGETLEATVLREVREEVGLNARNPRYIRSQAWPLPHSLMLGFNAAAAGEPEPDGVEIGDARWFTAGDLPHIPRQGTIARFLIDDWLMRIGAPPYGD